MTQAGVLPATEVGKGEYDHVYDQLAQRRQTVAAMIAAARKGEGMLATAGWQEGGAPVVVVFDHNQPTEVVAPDDGPRVIGHNAAGDLHVSIVRVSSQLPEHLEPANYSQ
jgi:hypothetical protein